MQVRLRFVGVLAVVATSLVACRKPAPVEHARPVAPPTITVRLREFRFEHTATHLVAGRTVFRFVNVGHQKHNPTLVPLDQDVPPIDVQVRGTARRLVAPVASVNYRQPGQIGTFAVDLIPGQRYAFVCFAHTPSGEAHSQKGMTWEFRVDGGSSAPGRDPAPRKVQG